MNNRGFTLVELLAVMIILISISLVAVGNVTDSLVRREEKECEEQKELAISAAKIYFSLNNGDTSVKLIELNDPHGDDYFKDDKKIDMLNEMDEIQFDGNNYNYIPDDLSCVE